MAISIQEKKIRKISKKTIENMTALGVYRPQFDATIRTYAEMRYQYGIMMDEFLDDGCTTTEEYTNKSGATNVRKTALYLAIETLRKDMVNFENILGLTPAGLKKINDELARGNKKGSKLGMALKNLET